MKGKYFFIESEAAKGLVDKAREMTPVKRGVERRVYLIGEYAVLATEKLKIRNGTVRDDDLAYFDEIVKSLMDLKRRGVGVVPILGYCYEVESEDGSGYIIEQRAKGEELYDDAVMKELYINGKFFSYLGDKSDVDAKKYIADRTYLLSNVPQEHFDKFIRDIIILIDSELLVDFNTKCNFFYDAAVGFQFIDIDSHTDSRYGLSEQKLDGREIAAYYGFEPCLFAADTKVLGNFALNEEGVSVLGAEIALNNRVIFEKCKTALFNNGVSDEQVKRAFEAIKIYGC